jgi:hypothetical protein
VTGAIDAGIGRVVAALRGREIWMIPILMTLFALGGTSWGAPLRPPCSGARQTYIGVVSCCDDVRMPPAHPSPAPTCHALVHRAGGGDHPLLRHPHPRHADSGIRRAHGGSHCACGRWCGGFGIHRQPLRHRHRLRRRRRTLHRRAAGCAAVARRSRMCCCSSHMPAQDRRCGTTPSSRNPQVDASTATESSAGEGVVHPASTDMGHTSPGK